MQGRNASAVDVGQIIDQGSWGGYQKWLVFLVALTIVFLGVVVGGLVVAMYLPIFKLGAVV